MILLGNYNVFAIGEIEKMKFLSKKLSVFLSLIIAFSFLQTVEAKATAPQTVCLNPDNGSYLWRPAGMTNLPTNGPYTIEAWVKPNTSKIKAGIAGWGDASGSRSNSFILTELDLNNWWYGNDLRALNSIPNQRLTTGTWYHVAAQWDGTTRTLYRDGKLVASAAASGLNASNTSTFKVGGYNGELFDGCMNSLRIVRNQIVYTGNFDIPESLAATQASGTNINAITSGNTSLLLNDPTDYRQDGSGNGNHLTAVAATVGTDVPSIPVPTYAITFNANGGSGSQTASSWVKNAPSATTLPTTTTFTRAGYSLTGWATSSDSTTPVLTYATAAAVTFYAIWTRNSYSVTFNKNSDTATGTMAIETRSATTALPANAFTWDANNTFQGWNTLADGNGTPYANNANFPYLADTTLYAQWGKTISYSSAGADSGSPSRSSDSWSSGAITLPTAGTMVKAGYTFGGWSNGVTTYTTTYTPTVGITLNPVWTPNTYTVSFNKNNGVLASGAVPSNQTWVESTTALTLSGNTGSMVRTGYDFSGWATSPFAPQTVLTTYSTTSNTLTQTLYAVWTPVSYTVTYALNGGTSTLPTQANKNINNTFTIAAAATRDGYVFGGWSDGTSIYSAGSTYTVGAANITLTAQWVPTYTVHYVMNGSLTMPTADTTTASGTIVALASAPSRTGYTFAGWVDNLPTPVTHAAGSNFTVIQDSTLQASWLPVAYTVTYALASGTSTLPTQASQNINNTFTIASTPTRAGYLFTGWSDGTNTYGAGASYVVGSSPITLTATWSAISYTVTYDLAGGTGTLPTKSNVTIGNTFTVSTVTDPTRLAYKFVGWSDGTNSYAKTNTYTAGSSNIVLTAVWNINGSTQITYANGGGSGILPVQAGLIEGSEFSLASGASLTNSGLAFAGWSDGTDTFTAGATYYVGPYTSPITLTAAWVTGYTVTYASDTGTGTVPVDATSRASGASFAVASASGLSKSGYTFAGWSDGTSTYAAGANYTFGSSDITLTAIWTLTPTPAPAPSPVITKVEEKPKETVKVITKETLSKDSPVVAVGVDAIKDSKKFDSFFTTPKAPAAGTTPAVGTTPVVTPITAANIVVVNANTSVNTQGVNTTSNKPVNVPITLTAPIITDEVAKALSAKVIVESSASNLKITAVNGFTGIVIVPVVATVNGVQTTVLNRVVVSPVLPVATGFTPVDIGKSSIAWQASTSQVISYEVAVNGKVACTTTTTSCPLPALIGPNTKVTVNAIGNDETTSGPQVIPYTAVKPIPALKVNFTTGSAVLTVTQKKEIAEIAKVINTQGFTRLVVNGFTDATGSPTLNAALSKARAASVVTYMKSLLPDVAVKAGANGAANPLANNKTNDGRAQNRRTEIATW